MPTVLRVDGWRVVIYPNDHPPAHVHVVGPGWIVVIDLREPGIREVIGCGERQARDVLCRVGEHRTVLLADWERWHG